MEIKNENMQTMIRRFGYTPLGYTERGEMNCVRPISRDYPRFHLYIKQQGTKYTFSLHLDQKRPSYGGVTAHSGEYEGDVVEDEAGRIKEITKEYV
ncbi:hypothetical protein A3A21_00730 [Candidatus Jorgensenbacteria bacterium RIFCSPLOWO2_01_FULL_45_25b]|uniref:Uncharacterized protein n=1 Tax=Candidatus Jorgensenbacteria bacterium RIFCSPLOWO2_01_FULL_45_25b TaxID=1798471 RepID=A0A1F6BUE3_9BACT|nr:MAG: hypothetical protein A3A21_00730 [Candidatus Jorgensenbacteria bacterium RIFCSPLOWO2_01_FULL_45_25b]